MIKGSPSQWTLNHNTFLSLSKNYFYEATLPPPRECSKKSIIILSFFVTIGAWLFLKLSSGIVKLSGRSVFIADLKKSLVYWSASTILIYLPYISTVSPMKKSAGTRMSWVPVFITACRLRKTPWGIPLFISFGSVSMSVESSK